MRIKAAKNWPNDKLPALPFRDCQLNRPLYAPNVGYLVKTAFGTVSSFFFLPSAFLPMPTPEPAPSIAPGTPLAAAPDATALLDPLTIVQACGDATRYAIMSELAKSDSLSVNDLAARLNRAP